MTIDEISQKAYDCEPMPKGLTFSEMLLFLSLRNVCQAYRRQDIDRETTRQERQDLIEKYREMRINERIYADMASRSQRISLLMPEMNKHGCPLCQKMVRIYDGRDRDGS